MDIFFCLPVPRLSLDGQGGHWGGMTKIPSLMERVLLTRLQVNSAIRQGLVTAANGQLSSQRAARYCSLPAQFGFVQSTIPRHLWLKVEPRLRYKGRRGGGPDPPT